MWILRNRLRRRTPLVSGPTGFDEAMTATIESTAAYTMTSPERMAAMCDAARYVGRHGIDGAIVECGVWRGGMMMAAARTLLEAGDASRDIYLFDTFSGMTAPTEADIGMSGRSAADVYRQSWAPASADEVRTNMLSTGYPRERVHLVEGDVLETVPDRAPERIAVLRLDTDWYESTRHELEHLVPRLSPAGILLVDDYGHWQGARRAVDEFLAAFERPVFLHRTDYTGRTAVIP